MSAADRHLLIVDDEPSVLKSIGRVFRRDGVHCYPALSAKEALELLEKQDIGVVVSDLCMPEMDGVSFLEKIKSIRPDVVRVLLTGQGSKNSAVAAINRSGVFMYLTKPWDDDALKAAVDKAFQHHELKNENRRLLTLTQQQNRELNTLNQHLEALVSQRTSALEAALENGILMLASAAEAKDDATGDHVRRIAALAKDICIAAGLSEKESEDISFASMMHDVGKIHIPDRILQKRGALTPEEREIMKTHTLSGERILGTSVFYQLARQIARSHHERWDGTGYPDGYGGGKIPISARIVAIADVFDALTHDRPYKPAWTEKEALVVMRALSGKAFDPELLAVFLGTRKKKRHKVHRSAL